MSTYEISKSSLLSLKAEILRKQQELGKTRAENAVKIKNLKKIAPLDLKNKNVEQRRRFDITDEEENLLKKSRAALEAKTVIYDELSKNCQNRTNEEIEHNKKYLVRFDKKSKISNLPPEESVEDYDKYPESDGEDIGPSNYEPPKNPDEEWVEYVDCLGRTRTCLRKDLEHVKSRDRDLKVIVDEKRKDRGEIVREKSPEVEVTDNKSSEPELTEENELLSSDMRREILRRQWEREEEELRNKSDVHYQDILFNEARTHGVGYYGFSKDEEERLKQQEALKKLRQETKEHQKKSQDSKATREKLLAARVKAAKNRKRARLGLPPEEDEPEQEPSLPPENPPETKSEQVSEKDRILEELRKRHIRPWDKGKEGVKEHYEYSQEEWVDKKRRERPSEFAPPVAHTKDKDTGYRGTNKRQYSDDTESRSLKFSSKKTSSNPYKSAVTPIVNEVADYNETNEKRGRGAEIAPPPTFDYYGPNDKNKRAQTETKGNIGDSIDAGLKFLREQVEKKQGSSRRSDDMFLF